MAVSINGSGTITGATTLASTIASPTMTTPTMTGAVVSAMGSSVITSGTAVASTSGTSIDFTSIPSWVKRITVMFNSVSTSGSSNLQIQLGDAGGIETTSYTSNCGSSGGGTQFVTGANITTGFLLYNQTGAGSSFSCQVVFTNVSGNIWVGSVCGIESGRVLAGGGIKTTSDTLTQLRVTTINGTDTFDAGSINILYE